MEITGWDEVIFTCTPPRTVFARVLASVLARWPDALVEGIDGPLSRAMPAQGVPPERLPEGAGRLFFYRDAAMIRHSDEAAFVPMPDGDGPCAVMTRLRRDLEFEVAKLDEIHAADREPGGVGPPHPYQAWICAPMLVEVTVLNPDDCRSHPFSAWLLAEVKRACREPA